MAWASEPSQVADFLQTGGDLGMASLRETWAPRIDPLSEAAASHGLLHSLSHSAMCDRPIFFRYTYSLRFAFSY